MESELSDMQFKGIIKMIIALIKKDTPKEELIEYLQELVKQISNTDMLGNFYDVYHAAFATFG